MTNPAQCHCGSISWERNIEESRFICASCKRPLWQPIETAPNDGTHILSGYWYDYSNYGDKPDWGWVSDVVFLIKTDGIVDGNRNYHMHYVRNGELVNIAEFYSHWMPLPEPPK
jgi:hypothetical protein